MSLSRRKFMKAGVVAACAALPLKSVLGQNGLGRNAQSSLPSSSKINPEQLGYYTESSFTPYLNTQFSVYLSPSSTLGLKLTEVSDYLSTLPKSETKGNPHLTECFSLLLTMPPGKVFEQDTYLIEHEALGNFYMFVVPVGQRGKTALDYYEAVFYRHPQIPKGYESASFNDNNAGGGQAPPGPSTVGTSTSGGNSKTEQEVFYFRPRPSAPVTPSDPGAAGRRAAAKLSMSQFPGISGLRLGMTIEQVLALFPGSRDDADVRAMLSRPPTEFGEQSLVIRLWKYSSKKRLDHINQVVITFLDGRASTFYIGYDALFWAHVDEFIAKFSGETRLPGADSWDAYVGLDTQLKTLRCKDFEISLFAGGNNVNINYVQMRDLTAQRKLKDRKARILTGTNP